MDLPSVIQHSFMERKKGCLSAHIASVDCLRPSIVVLGEWSMIRLKVIGKLVQIPKYFRTETAHEGHIRGDIVRGLKVIHVLLT